MTKFIGLGAKTYSYLINVGREDKKEKKCAIEKNLNYETCLEATQLDN